MEDIPAGAVQRVLQEARNTAGGDSRTMLALLQACYVEEAIRVAIAEQPSGQQLAAVSEFCGSAIAMLQASMAFYARASGGSEERQHAYLGRLHDAQEESTRFATFLRNRFETLPLTRTPVDADELPTD